MTREEKERIIELIYTMKESLNVLQTMIKKDEESSVVTTSKNAESAAPKEIDERMVRKFLKAIGVPMNLKGYRYICSAVVHLSREKGMKISLALYPMVAKEFGTTGSRVERAIRHAVERTFEVGNYDAMNEIFGPKVCASKGKLTNSEFMYATVEYLEDQLNR